MSETNREEIVRERLEKALVALNTLDEYSGTVQKELLDAIQSGNGRAFPIAWADGMLKTILDVHNEIARANGAALVRATEE